MKRFKNILLVLPEECDRRGALDLAATLARDNCAVLHVLEVIEALPPDIRSGLDLAQPVLADDPDGEAERESAARLSELLAPVRAEGVPGETKVATGAPAQVIADEAQRIGCDLLVLAAGPPHGLKQRLFGGTGTAGLFAGSTADKLFARLDCSLLVLHS